MADTKCAGIVVAAGKGTRMSPEGGGRKQFRSLLGKPVFLWSVEAFVDCPSIDAVVVVTGEDDVEAVRVLLEERLDAEKEIRVARGGETRRASVARGLLELGPSVEWVAVHDGVRPLVTPDLVERVLAAARESRAATAAVPARDTIKRVDQSGVVRETLDRSLLWAVQTPQAFSRELIERAHREVDDPKATDDCSLVEALGAPVRVVPGDSRNLKITTEEDWVTVNALASYGRAASHCSVTGFGFDVHRLESGRPLILGGVRIDHDKGLEGHSDADVLVHAIIDAILGGASMGDIGRHFPDTDEAFRGADSIRLLRRIARMIDGRGMRVVHVDAFISAERPRLSPHVPEMRANVSQALGIDASWVNVKAGTGERSGPVGREEVIEARAVATLLRPRIDLGVVS